MRPDGSMVERITSKNMVYDEVLSSILSQGNKFLLFFHVDFRDRSHLFSKKTIDGRRYHMPGFPMSESWPISRIHYCTRVVRSQLSSYPVVKLVLANGAGKVSREREDEWMTLHFAAQRDSDATLKELFNEKVGSNTDGLGSILKPN